MSSSCYGELPVKPAISAYERHALAQDLPLPSPFKLASSFSNMPASSSVPMNNPMPQVLDAPVNVSPKALTESVVVAPLPTNAAPTLALVETVAALPSERFDQSSPILDGPPSFGPLSPANSSGTHGAAGGPVPAISELDTSPAYGPAKPIPLAPSSSSPSLSAVPHSPVVLAVDTQSVSENAPSTSFVCDRQTISDLMNFFIKFQSALGSPRSTPVLRSAQDQVNELFSRDYNIAVLKNDSGEYCSTYPMDVVIIESVKRGIPKIDSSGFAVKVNDANVLKHLFKSSRYTRVHGRFVIPAILVRNKNIARSSTLSVYGETLLNHFTTKSREFLGSFYGSSSSAASSSSESTSTSVSFAVDQEAQRRADVLLLTKLGMKYICDLMVENRKKKLGLTVTSSEKVESTRYGKFKINVIPYPGCEFFKVFKESNYNGHEVKFDWTQSFVNAQLSVALESARTFSWDKYREWDIVSLTKNYIQLLLELLGDPEDESGLLVHCISGWDRTPLFISLLRLSLWADGECHQSLNAHEILYLTLAYDWMLFFHQLSNRLAKGEDLFYFCFYFLQFITGPEFALPNRVAAVQQQFQQQQTRQQAVSVSSASSSSTSAIPSPGQPNQPPLSPSPFADAAANLSLADQEALRELSPGLSDASSSVMIQAGGAMPSFPNGSSPIPASTVSPVAGSPPASQSLSQSHPAFTSSPGTSPDLRATAFASAPSDSALLSSRSPQQTALESPPNVLTQHFAAPSLSQQAGTSASASALSVASSSRSASIHPRPTTNSSTATPSKKSSADSEPAVFRVGSYEAVWTPANGAIPFDIESSSDTEGSPLNPRRSSLLLKETVPKEMSSHRTTTRRAFSEDDSDGENVPAPEAAFDDSEEDVTADMELDGDPVFKRSPTKKATPKPHSPSNGLSNTQQPEMNGHVHNHRNGITKPGSPGQTAVSKSRSNHSAFGSPKLGGISAALQASKPPASIPITTGPPPRAFSGSAAVSTRPSSTPIDIPSGMAPRARSDVPSKPATRPREPDGSDADFRTGSWQMVFDEHMDSRSVPGSVPRSLSRRTSNPLQVVFQPDELNFPAPASSDTLDHEPNGPRTNGLEFPPLTGLTLNESNRAVSPFEDPLGVTNGELPALMAQSVAHEPISNSTIDTTLPAPSKRPWEHDDVSPVPTEDSPFIRPDLPPEHELKPLVATEAPVFNGAAPLLQRLDPDELEEEDCSVTKQPSVPITATASPDGPVHDAEPTLSSATSPNPSPFESPADQPVDPPQSLRAQRLMEVHNLFMSLYHHHVIAPAAAAAAASAPTARPDTTSNVAELARCSTPSTSVSPTPIVGSPAANQQQPARATGFGYGLFSYFYPSNSGS